MDEIQITITLLQANSLLKMLLARLSWLMDQPKTDLSTQFESQAIQDLMSQIGMQMKKRILAQSQVDEYVSVWLYEKQRAEFSAKASEFGGSLTGSILYSPTLHAWNLSWKFADMSQAKHFLDWAQEQNEYGRDSEKKSSRARSHDGLASQAEEGVRNGTRKRKCAGER
jgi:hypothetical protein